MTKNTIIRLISVLLTISVLVCIFVGCAPEQPAEELVVWVYSDEYKASIERAFNADMTALKWKLNVVTVPSDILDQRIAEAVEDGTTPDVFMLSPDRLPYYLESGLAADLSLLGFQPDETRYYNYTTIMSTASDGVLRALCWQPDPGLFCYRRSLAKAYLGTDDPAEIQEMLSDWDGFVETARILKEQSGGATRMLAGSGELVLPYLFSDPDGWTDADGHFAVSSKADGLMTLAAEMRSEELIYDAEQWSEAWLAGMKDSQSVFGYFSSGIGMQSILRKACGGTIVGEGSFGDWAAVVGPSAYNWGGCWFAVSESSGKKQQAATFLEYFFSETEAMQKNSLISGGFSPSRNVVEQIKYDSQFAESFLSGQNYYVQMASAANDAVAGKMTPYDNYIDRIFTDCLQSYSCGYVSREQALDDLYTAVRTAYPELF